MYYCILFALQCFFLLISYYGFVMKQRRWWKALYDRPKCWDRILDTFKGIGPHTNVRKCVEICLNIAPFLSSGNHLFCKAEYMGRSYLNQVWAITFDWSAVAT